MWCHRRKFPQIDHTKEAKELDPGYPQDHTNPKSPNPKRALCSQSTHPQCMQTLHRARSGSTSNNHGITRQELKRRMKAAAAGETALQAEPGQRQPRLAAGGPWRAAAAHPLLLAHSSHLRSAPRRLRRAEVWCRQNESSRSSSLTHGTAPHDSLSLHPGGNPASQLCQEARPLMPCGYRLPSPAAKPSSPPLIPSSPLRTSCAGGTLLRMRMESEGRAGHPHSSRDTLLSTEAGPK